MQSALRSSWRLPLLQVQALQPVLVLLLLLRLVLLLAQEQRRASGPQLLQVLPLPLVLELRLVWVPLPQHRLVQPPVWVLRPGLAQASTPPLLAPLEPAQQRVSALAQRPVLALPQVSVLRLG